MLVVEVPVITQYVIFNIIKVLFSLLKFLYFILYSPAMKPIRATLNMQL